LGLYGGRLASLGSFGKEERMDEVLGFIAIILSFLIVTFGVVVIALQEDDKDE